MLSNIASFVHRFKSTYYFFRTSVASIEHINGDSIFTLKFVGSERLVMLSMVPKYEFISFAFY